MDSRLIFSDQRPVSTLFTEAFHPSPWLWMMKSEGEVSSIPVECF